MRRYAWLALLACSTAFSQNWVEAGMPGYNPTNLIKLVVDSLEDRLLVVGYTTVTGMNSEQAILRYREGAWDTIGTFYGGLADAERFGDTLVVAGASSLYAVNDVSVQGIAAYYSGAWHPFGSFDLGIRKLKLINGELYAIGGFSYVDGQLCNGIAKRVGGQWQCFDPPPQTQSGGGPDLYDAEWYQGQIYACGNFSFNANGENDIIAFDGSAWYAPGGGLTDGLGNGRCLTVYQDELYFGGGFTVQNGNAGNCIMKWNGTEWSGLNGDLQGYFGDNQTLATAIDFLHHDGKLLVCGEFSYVAGFQANRFAVWDGSKWCGYSDTFGDNSTCRSMAIYHDTLYAACGFELNGQPINQVVKWVGDPAFDGEYCNASIGIQESGAQVPMRLVSLGAGLFRIHLAEPAELRYRIVDAAGRAVDPWRSATVGQEAVVDLSTYANGLYLVNAVVNGTPSVLKIVHAPN